MKKTENDSRAVYKENKKAQKREILDKYGDIIYLPHHVSKTHPQMSLHDRAAQFSPFSALTGYGEKIKETQKKVEEEIQMEK